MMRTVQLSITDAQYLGAVREALCRSCAWHVDSLDQPDPSQPCVLVLDDIAFARLPLPLSNPERIVLISRRNDPQSLAHAWDAGIVSVVSPEDPMSTVLLAIMAAALRVAKGRYPAHSGEISPNPDLVSAPLPPHHRHSSSKRCKIQ
jgi:hypothetical protein